MSQSAVDLLIKNAFTMEHPDTVDIAIRDGTIVTIGPEITASAQTQIEADGQFVSPGLFECHLHMDKALVASGQRTPQRNDTEPTLEDIIRTNREYFGTATSSEIATNVMQVMKHGVPNGVLYYRSQTYTGGSADLAAIEGALEAKQAASSIANLQIVAFPQDGIQYEDNEKRVAEALEAGADILGGIDPAAQNGQIADTIDLWFDLADRFAVDMDVHIHEPDTLGMYTMNTICEGAMANDFDGNVTISHAYALADANQRETPGLAVYEDGLIENALDRFENAGLRFVTCYPSTPPAMPIKELFEREIPVSLATDNVQTYTDPRQSTNILNGALIEAYKLDTTANSYLTNPGLQMLWEMMTYSAAEVFGISDSYGIEEGNPATFVIFDAPSPEYAIIEQAPAQYVFKDGTPVAQDGTLQVSPSLQ